MLTLTYNEAIKNAWWRYNHYYRTVDDIYKAYTRPSKRKLEAWEYCRRLCAEHNGEGLRIVGHSPYIFSAGFTFNYFGRKIFCWITPSHDYYTMIDKMEVSHE